MATKRLDVALDFIGSDARTMLLDTIHAYFCNEAGTLEGNTPSGDLEWFAQQLCRRDPENAYSDWRWEQMPEATRAHYQRLAELVIDVLPMLVERMAVRQRAIADAIYLLMKAERSKRNAHRSL